MRITRTIGRLLIVAVATGCVPAPSGPASAPAMSAPRVWPEPPARARIRFVQSVARPADLAAPVSVWTRLGRAIVGAQDEWLIRPTAIVTRETILYVADPGAQGLWVIDTRLGRFEKIQRAGAQSLVSPVAVAVGRDRVYLADSFSGKIFIYTTDLALTGTIDDGDLQRPAGLAFDAARDRLYVADSGAHRVWIYSADGQRLGAIGRRGTGDGEFNFPTHVAVDQAGTLYVTDALGFRVQVFDRYGRFAGQFGEHGDSSGNFASPKGVALDSEGHIYVVEALFDAVQIFDRRGRFLLSFGERGVGPGQFWLPTGVFIDHTDRIYVADSYNQRIQVFQYLAGGGDE